MFLERTIELSFEDREDPMTILFLPLCLVSLLTLQTDTPTAPDTKPGLTGRGLLLVQETNGAPGRQSSGVGRQTLAVTEDRLVMIDHGTSQRFLMRLDQTPAQFFEISSGGREYTTGKDYAQTQAQRDAWEEELRRNRMEKSDAEWRHALEKNHIREDGSREVVVSQESAPSVTLGDRAFNVKKFVVRENGRVIVSALVTQDLAVDIPFFEFYRRLGAFSEDVLVKLKEIKGVPLKADITVVTSSFSHALTSKLIQVEERELQLDTFELPEGADEVTETPFVTCHKTGVRFERTSGFKLMMVDGRTLWFAQKRDWHEFRRANKTLVKGANAKPKPRQKDKSGK